MWAPGKDAPPVPDPRFEELRHLVTTLKARLADFDAHQGTRQALTSDELSDNNRATWQMAEAKVAVAREVHDRARQRERDVRPSQPWTDVLSRALAEVQDALAKMDHAQRVADRVERAQDLDRRVSIVQENARKAGDLETLAQANDLRRLHRTDPLDRNEQETEALEEMGFSAGVRTAVDDLAELQAARATVVKAVQCIAGFGPGEIPELDDLAAWLERIQENEADTTEGSASQQLGRWHAQAKEVGGQIFPASERAGDLLHQRNRLRGQLKVVRQDAGERGLSERPDVDLLVTQLAEMLRAGPLDLAVAEKLMLRLLVLLHGRQRRGR